MPAPSGQCMTNTMTPSCFVRQRRITDRYAAISAQHFPLNTSEKIQHADKPCVRSSTALFCPSLVPHTSGLDAGGVALDRRHASPPEGMKGSSE